MGYPINSSQRVSYSLTDTLFRAAVSYAGSIISHGANSGADVVHGGLEGIAGTVEHVP